MGGSEPFLFVLSLTGEGVTLGPERTRQVAITVQTFLFVDRLVVIFLLTAKMSKNYKCEKEKKTTVDCFGSHNTMASFLETRRFERLCNCVI